VTLADTPLPSTASNSVSVNVTPAIGSTQRSMYHAWLCP
jgi:hypothetical protein